MKAENKKTTKNKEKKSKKLDKRLIIILILIIVIVVSTIFIIQNKDKANESQNNNEDAYIEDAESQYGLIDMNNTENVKIENGVKSNISENLAKDKSIDGIEMTDIKLFAQEGISDFSATVKNNTGKDFAGGVATVKFINKDGSEYATLEVYVPELKNGNSNSINAATTADITNAYDFTITKK